MSYQWGFTEEQVEQFDVHYLLQCGGAKPRLLHKNNKSLVVPQESDLVQFLGKRYRVTVVARVVEAVIGTNFYEVTVEEVK